MVEFILIFGVFIVAPVVVYVLSVYIFPGDDRFSGHF